MIEKKFGSEIINPGGDLLEIRVKGKPTEFIAKFIKEYKGEISHLDIIRPTLNDVFMNITGKDIRE